MEYPTYAEIEEYVMTHPEYFEHWAEYSETNHARMAKIFRTLLHKQEEAPELLSTRIRLRSMRIHVLGLQILDGGGMTALTGCFYIFVVALRILRERPAGSDAPLADPVEMRRRLSWMWEGLGEWEG